MTIERTPRTSRSHTSLHDGVVRGLKWLSVATVVAAAGSFAILLISARALPTAINIQFVAFWGLYFALNGVLGGLMQETTRAVGVARTEGHAEFRADSTPPAARPFLVSFGVAAVTFVFMAATGTFWAPLVVSDHSSIAAFLMALGLSAFALQAAVSGILSGQRLWGHYAALIIIDIGVRVVLALLAWWASWGLVAWLLITVIGAVSWVPLVLCSPRARAALQSRADVPARSFISLMLTAMAAAGASAVLVTGFPTLIKIAGEAVTEDAGVVASLPAVPADNSWAALVTIGGIAYAVTLTRAPLLMPLEKFHNAIIVHFVHHRNEGALAALARPLAALVAFGGVGSLLAWALGPWLLELILNHNYRVPGIILAGLTFAATLTAVLLVTGAVTLAVSQHRMYLLGWLAATAVAVGILFLPGHLSVRTVAAIALGSLVGIGIHLWALRNHGTSTTAPSPQAP